MPSLIWKLGGVALACVAAYFLVTMYGGARYKQGASDSDKAWSAKVIQAQKDSMTAFERGVASVNAAEATYHETVRERIIPITKTIVERTTAYAQTPAGNIMCLPPERVRYLDEARSALFPAPSATPAPSGTKPVSTDTPNTVAGWFNDPRASGIEPWDSRH